MVISEKEYLYAAPENITFTPPIISEKYQMCSYSYYTIVMEKFKKRRIIKIDRLFRNLTVCTGFDLLCHRKTICSKTVDLQNVCR